MIFSKDKWSDSDELNKFIPVSAALSFERVESSLNDAFRLFILPLFGEQLSAEIESYYSNTDATEIQRKLLEECQRAVANLAFWYNYTELNVRITDQGMQRQESADGTFKGTYKYQEDQLRNSFRNKGFNSIDRMIEFLDTHADEFSGYEQSPAYVQRKQAIVRSTAEVDKICFINKSHLIFLRLKPLFQVVEETQLQPVLGSELYRALTQALADGTKTIGETTTEELRIRCAQYVIFKAIAELARATGSLTDRGLYFANLTAGDGNLQMSPADRETAAALAINYERQADGYLTLLQTFIENDLPAYYKGRQIDALDRDNTDKRTFWA